MSSIRQLLSEARLQLKDATDTPELDAEVLLAHIMGKSRGWVLAHDDEELTASQAAEWQAAIAKIEAGLPLPYYLGEWEFYGRKFQVTPDVLIPRPETELLVEQGVEWLKENQTKRRAVDVGTGSGIIAVTLAAEIGDLEVLAVDLSEAALAIAKGNAKLHGVEARVRFKRGNLLAGVDEQFDLICANLPYVPSERLPGLKVSKQEPMLALDGGGDGFGLVRQLAQQAKARLAPDGLLLAEIDVVQQQIAEELGKQTWPSGDVRVLNDLTGRPRLLRVQA